MKKRNYAIIFIITLIIVNCSFLFINVRATDEKTAKKTQIEEYTPPEETKYDSTNIKENTIENIIIPLAIEFFGACLGFLTALGINSLTDKKQYKEINDSLYDELKNLEKDLTNRFEQKQEYYRYLTPIWDINLASGNLSLLANKHIDKEYIKIYSQIQYAQELEREYIHSKLITETENNSFLPNYIDTIDSARLREAENIIIAIGKLEKRKDVK